MTIWITDKNVQCTYINKTWLDFTNSKLKENLGDNWLKFLHVEDKERGMEAYMEAFKKRDLYSVKYRVKSTMVPINGFYIMVFLNLI